MDGVPSGTREKGGWTICLLVLLAWVPGSLSAVVLILLQPRALAAADAGSCVTGLVTMAGHHILQYHYRLHACRWNLHGVLGAV